MPKSPNDAQLVVMVNSILVVIPTFGTGHKFWVRMLYVKMLCCILELGIEFVTRVVRTRSN